MQILVIGDFHYPDRARYPTKIFNQLKNQTFDLVLCTGDLTDISILDELEKLGPVKIVQGNMDWKFKHPKKQIIQLDKIKIGLIHGHQVHPRGDLNKLAALAKESAVQILISGHTHAQSIDYLNNGILLINPGSAAGAWSFLADGIPSYIIIEINNNTIKLIKYQYIANNFKKDIFSLKNSDLI